MLAAALLTIPAIGIEQSDVGEPWDTLAGVPGPDGVRVRAPAGAQSAHAPGTTRVGI